MAAELPSVRFAKINLESTPAAFAREQGVKALPTFHVFRAGARVGEMSGNNPTKRESQCGFLTLPARPRLSIPKLTPPPPPAPHADRSAQPGGRARRVSGAACRRPRPTEPRD